MARDLAHIATALSRPWAITSEGLDELVFLARREDIEIKALAPRAQDHVTGGVSAGDHDVDGDGPPKRKALAEGDDYLREYGKSIGTGSPSSRSSDRSSRGRRGWRAAA